GLALLLHELRHHLHERIHQSQKGSGPKIPASSPKELVSLSQRGDLKLRQCLCRPLPGPSISRLIQGRTRKLCRQPSVPGGMSRDYVGHEAREESRQGDGYRKLPPVGLTHCLKPQSWSVCLKSEQCEGRAGIKLSELSIQTKSVRLNFM